MRFPHRRVPPPSICCLLNGLDAIGLTLQHEAAISTFEAKQPSWI